MGKNDHNPEASEADIFRSAMGDVAPLKQDKNEPFKPRRRPVPLELDHRDDDQDDFAEKIGFS